MLASNAWLFIRGPQSVHMVRQLTAEGVVYLRVNGPAHAIALYVGTSAACGDYQHRLEVDLEDCGFRLTSDGSDRREGPSLDIPPAWDRRRRARVI